MHGNAVHLFFKWVVESLRPVIVSALSFRGLPFRFPFRVLCPLSFESAFLVARIAAFSLPALTESRVVEDTKAIAAHQLLEL
tara:strand:+ start:944 stop:1189 length:246 start_codon:yes stop_codon:yes gene_type:complete